MRNLLEEMVETLSRVVRIERKMFLRCVRVREQLWRVRVGLVEWRLVGKDKTSQSLGKSSEKNKLCEEKTSVTDDDDAKIWRKLGKLEQIMFDSKQSWRTRDEQANSANGVAHFRNASRAEGACVDTPGSSSGTQILSKVARSWPGTCCPITRGVFH